MLKIRDYIQIGVATIVAAVLIKLFVLDAVIVSSPSMEHTLLVGDLVLVNKMVDTQGPRRFETFGAEISMPHLPFLGTLNRGDVVVFRYPGDRDEPVLKETIEYVKRCAGMPGDTVELRNGVLFVNGVRVQGWNGTETPRFPREFSDSRLFPKDEKQNLDFYGPLIIPKRGYVIHLQEKMVAEYGKLIRNEGHSLGYGPEGYTIDGVVTTRYTVSQNYLFVLGDNNYESSDSRFWGFLPEQNVIGRATLIYWSKLPGHPRTDGEGGLSNFMASIRWDRIGALVR